MIMLTYWKKKAPREYDLLMYTSLSVPERCTQPGIEHRKELACSEDLGRKWGQMPEEEWGALYEQELRSDKFKYIQKLLDESDSGKWIQILFFEESPEDGERKWLYNVLKDYTPDVYIE